MGTQNKKKNMEKVKRNYFLLKKKMEKTRRRKRIGSTSTRGVKWPKVSQTEVRNAKEISPNSEAEILRQQVAHIRNKIQSQNLDIEYLQNQKDAAFAQLTEANKTIANQSVANLSLKTQISHVTEKTEAAEFAKKLMSDSLADILKDYEKLLTDYKNKTAAYLRETTGIKIEMEKLQKASKEGAMKIAKIAKSELKKAHEKNVRLQLLLAEVTTKR